MKKGTKFYALLFLGLAIGLAFVSCSLPRRSEQSIRQRILHETPQGSTYASVLDYAKKPGLSVAEQSRGYEIQKFRRVPARIVGKRVIKAYLGHYRGLPWRMDVVCFWAFDEHDKLIDIFVDKQADAP